MDMSQLILAQGLLPTVHITGRLPLPDASIVRGSFVSFALRRVRIDRDTENVILTAPVVVPVNDQGEIDAWLAPNVEGEVYTVTASFTSNGPSQVFGRERHWVHLPLGVIAVPEAGPVAITDLLQEAGPLPDVPDLLEQVQGALAQALAASNAAQSYQAASRTVATWAALSALTGTTVGEGAEVLDSDTGSHTQSGATVPNAGRYSWTGSAWSRIGDTGLSGVKTIAQDEVADRQALIDASADGTSVTIKDAVGNVGYRFSGKALRMMGLSELSDFGSQDFFVKDGLGFVSFRVSNGRATHMGKPIASEISLDDLAALSPSVELRRTGLLTRGPRDLPTWRLARAGVLQGVRRARIACIGDSNTMGWRSGDAGSHLRARSYPSTLARLLRDLNGTDDNVFGRALTTATGYPAYDPRLVVGSGWSPSGTASLGGEMWINSTSTNALIYTPSKAWDTATVWVASDAASALTIGKAGDLFSHTPTAGQITALTYLAGSVSTQALEIARLSGAPGVIGWDCWDSTRSGVSVLGMGRSGWRSDQYADASTYSAPMAAMASIDADLFLIQLGLNDWNQNRDPAVFQDELIELVDAAQASGADAALIVPMYPDGSRSYQWSAMRDAIYAAAAARAVPVIDFGARLGPYAEANADGFIYDNLHPNGFGYGDSAVLAHHLINR